MISPASKELISISITAKQSTRYKSIQSLTWSNIPKFSILTGRNGAGKSQLLELLAYRLSGIENHPESGSIAHMIVAVSGDAFQPDDIVYIPTSGQFAHSVGLSVASVQQAKENFYQQIQHEHQVQNNVQLRAKRARITKLLGVQNLAALGIQEFKKRIPDDFIYMLEENDVITGLAHVILGYRLQRLQELEDGREDAEILAKLGPAPWDVLNEILKVADFHYDLEAPQKSRLLEPYEFRLIDRSTKSAIRPGDLSAGEKVILQLVLWLFNSKHNGRFPRLMLLDEPDAHLHPSMARQLMDVLQDVLVERYGVRVIITTHSPSTVALAPEGCLFEMTRGQPTIEQSASRSSTIGLLTAGFVTVSATTRFVLVEDQDDVEYYEALRDILSDYGPSRDQMALNPSPSIVFLPSSLGKGSSKIGGGKGAVEQWVQKFSDEPFGELVRGVIDRDTENIADKRILTSQRYSIENYLLDPFVIFAVLIDLGFPPNLPGISVSAGDEHLIRSLDNNGLQIIADYIFSVVEPNLNNLGHSERDKFEIEFTNGKKVFYPKWMIDRQGHGLQRAFQSVFGGAQLITPPRLRKFLRRVRLVPKDQANLMCKLQNG